MDCERDKRRVTLRIAITGATGLLGRNFLFEIIKRNLKNLDNLEILLLGRDKNKMHIKERIQNIIAEDGISYLSLDQHQFANIKKSIFDSITCVNMNLREPKLNINSNDLKIMKKKTIDAFFHIAALTDFRNTASTVKALKETNVNGTKQILDLTALLKVDKFYYISSAYSCGETTGDIKPDHVNLNQRFRNPYEKSKLEAEILVRNIAKKNRMKCTFFRPSTICGRLIEQPIGSVHKFDVFYAWTAFFLHLKTKQLKELSYSRPLNLEARIFYSLHSGLNIVPADYAAKVMYQVFLDNLPDDSFYLVNDKETPHKLYVPIMLTTVNIEGTTQINCMPKDMNPYEKLYYKSIGKIFTPYVISAPMLFDSQNLQEMLKKNDLICPVVDELNFSKLMEYAKKSNFGIG